MIGSLLAHLPLGAGIAIAPGSASIPADCRQQKLHADHPSAIPKHTPSVIGDLRTLYKDFFSCLLGRDRVG